MNYISHFYFAKNTTDPLFHFGNMLPDLSRGLKNKFRSKETTINLKALSPINDGIIFHHKTDKVFHAAPFFNRYNVFIKNAMQKKKISSISKFSFFVTHILFELTLDHLIIINHPNILDDFYNTCKLIKKEQIYQFMELTKHGDVKEELYHHFSNLIGKGYFRSYAHTENLVYALSKIYFSVCKIQISNKDITIFEEITLLIKKELEQDWQGIFEMTRKGI